MSRAPGVQIKGTRDGLVILFNPAYTFEELKESLLRQLEHAREFFQGARVTFYTGDGEIHPEQKQELLRIVAQYGLTYADNITYPLGPTPHKPGTTKAPSATSPLEPNTTPQNPLPAGLSLDSTAPALLVKQSLRSGQAVRTEKNLVILGDVHPGAEVAAGGSIVVLGSLGGQAAAGCYGDRSAVVIAYKLTAVSLSIAGITATLPPKPLTAVKALLQGNQVVYRSLYK